MPCQHSGHACFVLITVPCRGPASNRPVDPALGRKRPRFAETATQALERGSAPEPNRLEAAPSGDGPTPAAQPHHRGVTAPQRARRRRRTRTGGAGASSESH
eukprot:scaffold1717_cov377-Prasinococcus_capsulatus_cf.AAC.9